MKACGRGFESPQLHQLSYERVPAGALFFCLYSSERTDLKFDLAPIKQQV
jgi:hypothetical protein